MDGVLNAESALFTAYPGICELMNLWPILPHPSLSRWEREYRRVSRPKTCDGIRGNVIHPERKLPLLFPLPAGEG
jgi:hypothetical protein